MLLVKIMSPGARIERAPYIESTADFADSIVLVQLSVHNIRQVMPASFAIFLAPRRIGKSERFIYIHSRVWDCLLGLSPVTKSPSKAFQNGICTV